ncbi:MAG: insulinase family protein [Bacilli bacterium]|nr:insulinase family protein [Bacilli bacterium]
MEEKIIEIANEKLYYSKLDNGLEVYMIPNNNVKNVYATFTTKYGSIHDEFVPINSNKMISVPKGIAHFLEHKMFEQEDGINPFEFFSKSGTNANAHTALKNTTYEFMGPNNFIENINYLLDYVQELYITDDSVEKEKGIIEQELKMYMDDPFWSMYDGIRNNIFSQNPTKYPIGGTVESIYKITKEDLEKCYNTFYNPANMFVVITGNFDPNITLNEIKENQEKKNFKPMEKVKIKEYKENDKVVKDYMEIEKNIDINKFSYGIKINLSKLGNISEKKKRLYISIIFDTLFGITSEFYEQMTEKNYLSSPLGIDKIYTDTHALITLIGETNFPKELFAEINALLKNLNIEETDLERSKKILHSINIKMFDNIEDLNDTIISNVINYGTFDENFIKLSNELNMDELKKILKKLDVSNKAIFLVKPFENNL